MVEGELLLPADEARSRLTHYLFRYPAKFHPPVVRALLTRFTNPGDRVLDPFVGSGTLLVEAALCQRRAVGVDVDPVAVDIALAKTRRYDLVALRHAAKQLLDELSPLERSAEEYMRLMHLDISEVEFAKVCSSDNLSIPAIPNLHHWFRNYVVIDLARINEAIVNMPLDDRTELLFQIVFASIIRNSSNADPVPVSGLEYTAHMKRRDEAGRLVNPFALFRSAIKKALAAAEEWLNSMPSAADEPMAFRGTALDLPDEVPLDIDAVITSPPYHNAVDYYRRHQLEMFWLGHTKSQRERLTLLPEYVGRPRVALSNPLFLDPWDPPALADTWERKIRERDEERANDFRHYVQAMSRVFGQLASRLPPGGPAVFVLGQSTWNGEQIPTEELFSGLATPAFDLQEVLSYPVKNRYMSYTRHNKASIDKEYVLVLRRSAG